MSLFPKLFNLNRPKYHQHMSCVKRAVFLSFSKTKSLWIYIVQYLVFSLSVSSYNFKEKRCKMRNIKEKILFMIEFHQGKWLYYNNLIIYIIPFKVPYIHLFTRHYYLYTIYFLGKLQSKQTNLIRVVTESPLVVLFK